MFFLNVSVDKPHPCFGRNFSWKKGAAYTQVNTVLTEVMKMVDQLQQDCSNANAVLGDTVLQSSPKWKVMKSMQPEEDLGEDAKIGNITRSVKKVNCNIIPSS